MLSSDNSGVILPDRVDQTDEMYQKWHSAEDISLHEYLKLLYIKQWIDLTKLTLEDQYSDSNEVYNALVRIYHRKVLTNNDFSKDIQISDPG